MSTEERGGAKIVRLEGALDVAAPPGPAGRVFERTNRLLRICPTVEKGLAALAA